MSAPNPSLALIIARTSLTNMAHVSNLNKLRGEDGYSNSLISFEAGRIDGCRFFVREDEEIEMAGIENEAYFLQWEYMRCQ